MDDDIVTRLRPNHPTPCWWPVECAACLAADLIKDIEDAVSKWDGCNGDDIAARVHVLLHPDEVRGAGVHRGMGARRIAQQGGRPWVTTKEKP